MADHVVHGGPDARGLTFLRHDNGDVTVEFREYEAEHGKYRIVVSTRVPADRWCELMADVSLPAWELKDRSLVVIEHRHCHFGNRSVSPEDPDE